MDLYEIPFDVPVIIQSIHSKRSLQNPLGSKKARCLSDNLDIYEQLFLRRACDDKVAIQSARNGRYMQVRTNGDCYFDRKEPEEMELFSMETDSDCRLYFVSCSTGNVLQCTFNNHVRCVNQNRKLWEAWKIVEPRNSAAFTQIQRDISPCYVLGGSDRQNFVIELAKCGKTPKEIEEIVTCMFDAPLATVSAPTLVSPADKA